MQFEEMLVALVGAIGAFVLVGYLGAKILDLIKTWINRNKSGYDEETFERLAKAFMRHKEQSEKRFRKLESLLKEGGNKEGLQIEAPKETIEIEEAEEKETEKADNGNLNNMLRE